MSQGECANECKISDCESNCVKSENDQGICAKDGYVYPSKCVMGCRNQSLVARWKCKSPFNAEDCGYRCAHARNAELGYHAPHKERRVEAAVFIVGDSL